MAVAVIRNGSCKGSAPEREGLQDQASEAEPAIDSRVTSNAGQTVQRATEVPFARVRHCASRLTPAGSLVSNVRHAPVGRDVHERQLGRRREVSGSPCCVRERWGAEVDGDYDTPGASRCAAALLELVSQG